MVVLDRSRQLKKELGLLSVYAIGTGTTLSSGFFLLPGVAAEQVGPGLVLAYLLAVLPLVPATFCMVELATAMPRAGGAYYYLDRSMGPLVGTIGGMGTWISLALKAAFALVGMGAYLTLILPAWIPMLPISLALTVLFGILNLYGARASGIFQILLVGALLAILTWFIGAGLPQVDYTHFAGAMDKGFGPLLSTAGMVYVSYIGVTKVASISEEVKDPERVLPRAVFLAVGTTIVVYTLGTTVMVGVLPPHTLPGELRPVAETARVLAGRYGVAAILVAAILAFSSVANASILSASRYPLAMSRDHLLPRFAGLLSARGIPRAGVLLTVGLMLVFLLLFDPSGIAKLASAFQLLMFALICLAVIVMRESQIPSYDPGYRSPLYPYVPIAGILLPLWLLSQIGWLSALLTLALVTLCVAWYFRYVRPRVARTGAVYHIFERLGRFRYTGLDTELRGILKEKGVRATDPFDELIAHATFLEAERNATFEEVTRLASAALAGGLAEAPEWVTDQFLQGTRVGATPVARGVALPHFRHRTLTSPRLVIVRSHPGLEVKPGDVAWGGHSPEDPIHALFYLVSPESDPAQHLRVLAQIAKHVDDDGFMSDWLDAHGELEMKEILLRDERFLSLELRAGTPTEAWIGQTLRTLHLPEGCLVALIRRGAETLVPGGSSVLEEGDRLTIIGDPAIVRRLGQAYHAEGPPGAADPAQ